VQRHELAAVRERRLHLDLVHELRDPFHHVVAAEHVTPRGHQLGDRAALAGPLDHPAREQRDGLGLVELDPPLAPVAGDHPGDGEQELRLVRRRQLH